ncbi:Sec-independent protein translocase protein TatB [Pseudothauera hydrothermalis]|uniref:Sec-independent protein translocase protein TatB n=1 Tax=Pseudothauera hydrothermalis TaxID=2184083 RepID=UPI000E091BFA|nr:Sec-independent protein translocase protein TatB [Pseudothauera hydrothermalis]
MFDFGFSELLLIAVVALIVVGPERLPKVARTAGHLLGRLQRYVSDVKADIQREMQLEELKKLQQQVAQQARELEGSIRKQMNKVEAELETTAKEVEHAVLLEAGAKAASTAGGAPSAGARVADDGSTERKQQDDGLVEAQKEAPAKAQLELGLSPAASPSGRPAEKA